MRGDVWLAAGVRTPFAGIDGALRTRLHDGTEPSTALLLGTLNRMFGRPFAFEGRVPSPGEHYGSGLGTLPTGQGFTASSAARTTPAKFVEQVSNAAINRIFFITASFGKEFRHSTNSFGCDHHH